MKKISLLTVLFFGAAFAYGQTEPPKNPPKAPATPSTPKAPTHGDISTSFDLDNSTHSTGNMDGNNTDLNTIPVTSPITTRGSAGTTVGGSGSGSAAFNHNKPAHSMGSTISVQNRTGSTRTIVGGKTNSTSPSAIIPSGIQTNGTGGQNVITGTGIGSGSGGIIIGGGTGSGKPKGSNGSGLGPGKDSGGFGQGAPQQRDKLNNQHEDSEHGQSDRDH